MGFGNIVGAMWFLLLSFAGLTSAIAMYNYLVALIMENSSMVRKNASIAVFIGYIIVGLPVALEPILTKTADLMYFTEVDNWVGNYFLFVLGLIEIIVTGSLFREKGLPEINRGGYWQVPGWFYKAFIQFLTPVLMIVVLVMYTIDTAKAGYYKFIPDFVAGNDVLIPWVQAGRVVVFGVVAIGCWVTYNSIKRSYKEELEKNEVIIRL
jgi:SNF family Na+-dependent transporter